MNTIGYLKENYGYGVPIFLKDLRIGHKSKTAIKQDLYRAVKSGEMVREGQGVYSLNRELSKNRERPVLFEDIIESKYIKPGKTPLDDLLVYGYYSGHTFLNIIGISQQVPAISEITTNKTSSKKRYYKNGKRIAIIRKSKTNITFQNWKILQFLDMFNWLDLEEVKSNKELLKKYIKANLTKYALEQYLNLYGTKTIKLLIESGLINAFR